VINKVSLGRSSPRRGGYPKERDGRVGMTLHGRGRFVNCHVHGVVFKELKSVGVAKHDHGGLKIFVNYTDFVVSSLVSRELVA